MPEKNRTPISIRARLAAVVVAAALALAACGSPDRPSFETDAGAADTTVETTSVPTAPPTTVDPTTSFVAASTVQGQQQVFDSPGGAVKTSLPNPWVGDSPLVFLVKADHGEWLEVYLPVRPNGSTGFVRSSDVSVTRHNWRIEVRLSEFKIKVFEGDELFLDTGIAVSEENTPTPGGLYYTTELLQPPDPNGAYGTYAYGLSGFSDILQSFNGGPGQLGLHGTNQPELIGQRVSHGCIRMRNEDIEQLAAILPLGVPVQVIP